MHILKQKPMESYILFKRILNGNNLRQSKNFTNVGYVFNLIETSMVYIYKHINKYSFHPFIQNVLNLILDAHVFLDYQLTLDSEHCRIIMSSDSSKKKT